MTTQVRNTAAILVLALLIALGVALASPAEAQSGAFITSEDIVNQTIRSADIGSGGVASSEVRNQSLRSWDLGPGSVGASEIRDNAVSSDEIENDSVEESDLSLAVQDKLNGHCAPGQVEVELTVWQNADGTLSVRNLAGSTPATVLVCIPTAG
jgi:hypothetical protein